MNLKLTELLSLIDSPNREKCFQLTADYFSIFSVSRGSEKKHQAWTGGYLDHIVETMNIAVLLYETLSSQGRPLPFSASDTLLVLFLHDLEKPFKQASGEELGLVNDGKKINDSIFKFKYQLMEKYEFDITSEHLNAFMYIEGEGSDYCENRMMNELAAFCHMCDIWSARGWYNYPKH